MSLAKKILEGKKVTEDFNPKFDKKFKPVDSKKTKKSVKEQEQDHIVGSVIQIITKALDKAGVKYSTFETTGVKAGRAGRFGISIKDPEFKTKVNMINDDL